MEGKLIGEIASEAGVRPGTLRYYEALRLLPVARRSRGGYRLYNEQAGRRLAFITNAKSLGLTLREIRQVIAQSDGRTSLRVSPCYPRRPSPTNRSASSSTPGSEI